MNRNFNDLKDIFLNSNDIEGNPLIYEFDNIVPSDSEEELLYGVTILYPGTINGEYYMTKGHKHQISCAEVYYGLEGSGLVLCEKDGVSQIHELSEGVTVYCPPGYAHRVINNTECTCKFYCVCRADAGHDYNIEFTKRFIK
jgi:glucose-6-phosphate isomerase